MIMSKSKIFLAIFLSALVGAGIVYLATDIAERRAEWEYPFFKVVEIGPLEDDPAIWGKNFPLQYESYLRTTDMVRTRHGGSEAIPRTPKDADPRSYVARSRLEEDPRLKLIWAGYPFSVDTREARGHAYMLMDQLHTDRVHVTQQYGACVNCHASSYVTMMKLGEGDLWAGFSKLNQMPFQEAVKHVSHPLSCVDCHDNQSMALRITRPAFIEGIRAYKASQGIKNYDVTKDATRQEMRTFVCAQCHVEYYFQGPEKRLTYPWAEGIKAEETLKYYQKNGHTDWVHAETGARVLKAQHPEFEMWSQGSHAKAGVSCVDCHMPYERVGAMKITNHHVRSPLLHVNKACQTCHHQTETELLSKAHLIQERHLEMRNRAMDALVALIKDLKRAREQGLKTDILAQAQNLHREAQYLVDFVEAENSGGFHAPQESGRVLMLALDKIRVAQLLLARK
jgi:nitrite reductase (cytochrome c-552)